VSNPSAPNSSCVDAEKLAAWSEGALSAAETADVELHLSNCTRCQEMLAAFGRTSEGHRQEHRKGIGALWLVPLAAAAALLIWVGVAQRQPPPALQTASKAETPAAVAPESPVTVPASSLAQGQVSEPRAGAGTPSARPRNKTMADAPAPRPVGQTAPGVAQERFADARQAPPPAPASAPPTAAAPRAAPMAVPPPPASPPAPPPSSALSGTVTDSAGSVIPGATVRVTRNGAPVTDAVTDASGRYRVPGLTPGPYDVSVAVSGFRTLARSGVEAASGVETVMDAALQVAALSETVAVSAATPQIQASTGERSFTTTAGRAANLPLAGRSSNALAPLTPGVLEIVAQMAAAPGVAGGRGGGGGGRGGAASQDAAFRAVPATRWRFVKSGTDERSTGNVMLDAVSPAELAVGRSTDGGVSWQPISIDRSVTITGGAAPSNSVCWLIGPKGVILRSTDGLRFSRVPFPETVDLASIRATNAREASVTTADRRTFSTVDGGTTWVQGFDRPPF